MISMDKVKGNIACAVSAIMFSYAIISIYRDVSTTAIGLIRGDSYVNYDPKQVPLILLLPSLVLMNVFFICPFIPFGNKIAATILKKLVLPATLYSIGALVTGIVISIIISIYPLGTNYYKCDSTSIVSSGSYYAKSKEICKQRAYSAETSVAQ